MSQFAARHIVGGRKTGLGRLPKACRLLQRIVCWDTASGCFVPLPRLPPSAPLRPPPPPPPAPPPPRAPRPPALPAPLILGKKKKKKTRNGRRLTVSAPTAAKRFENSEKFQPHCLSCNQFCSNGVRPRGCGETQNLRWRNCPFS